MNKNETNITEVLDKVMRMMRRSRGHEHRGGRGVHRLLATVSENRGISSRELAEVLDIRPSSLNEMLGRMEEEGLVQRERSESDQRVITVALLPEGKEELIRIQARENAYNEKVNSILNKEERQTFVRLAGQLAEGLEALRQEDGEKHHRKG